MGERERAIDRYIDTQMDRYVDRYIYRERQTDIPGGERKKLRG